MSTTTPNTSTTATSWARRRNDRRAARRDYTATERRLNAYLADLHEVEYPADRARLLTEASGLVTRLADLHTTAFGLDPIAGEHGRPMAESLRASVAVLDLAAWSECELQAAQWTSVEDLTSRDQAWFAGRFVPVAKLEELPASRYSVPIRVTLAYDDGDTETLDFEAGETVRIGGPTELEITQLTEAAGIDGDEAALWERLATTYDRDIRAGLLLRIADEAERRIGATAAGVLRVLADTEAALAAPEGYDATLAQAREDARVRTSELLLLMWLAALVAWVTWSDSHGWPWQVALWGGFAAALAARFGAVPLLPGNRWGR